jgi:hypothetical protein
LHVDQRNGLGGGIGPDRFFDEDHASSGRWASVDGVSR